MTVDRLILLLSRLPLNAEVRIFDNWELREFALEDDSIVVENGVVILDKLNRS